MKHEIHWGTDQTNEAMGLWAAHQIWGDDRRFKNFKTMGVLIDDKPAAVMVYHNYNPHDGVIEMSGAGIDKRWLNMKAVHDMFAYPFDQLGCQLVVHRNDPEDKALTRMLKAWGFEFYLIPRLRGRDKAEQICTLTVEDWRNTRYKKRRAARLQGIENGKA